MKTDFRNVPTISDHMAHLLALGHEPSDEQERLEARRIRAACDCLRPKYEERERPEPVEVTEVVRRCGRRASSVGIGQ